MEGYHSIGVIGAGDSETAQPESSAWAARRTSQSLSPMHRCAACQEQTEFVNIARAPCQREYCHPCLEDLFKASLTDESLFPPQCCRQPININIARIFLKSDLIEQYEKKKIKFKTPKRTYCYYTKYSAFINTLHINGEVATCPSYGHTTCTNCKGRAHMGDCPNNTAIQQLSNRTRKQMATLLFVLENGGTRSWLQSYDIHNLSILPLPSKLPFLTSHRPDSNNKT